MIINTIIIGVIVIVIVITFHTVVTLDKDQMQLILAVAVKRWYRANHVSSLAQMLRFDKLKFSSFLSSFSVTICAHQILFFTNVKVTCICD